MSSESLVIGSALPEAVVYSLVSGKPLGHPLRDWTAGRTVVLIGVPGAFTPTCSEAHLPGFVVHADELRARGVAEIGCIAVNDPFVMAAWAAQQQAEGRVTLLSDGNGEFARAARLTRDLSSAGMGERNKRFALVAVDGVIVWSGIDESGLQHSSADAVLAALNAGIPGVHPHG